MNFHSMIKSLEIHDQVLVRQALDYPVQAMLREFELSDSLKSLASVNLQASDLTPLMNEIANQNSARQLPVKKINYFEVSLHSPLFSRYFHRHNYFELDYIYQGSCRYYIEDEDNSSILQQGELCIINQNVAHAIELMNDHDIVLKCFIPLTAVDLSIFTEVDRSSAVRDFITGSLAQETGYYAYMVFRPAQNEIIQDILGKLIAEYLEQTTGWKRAVENYLSLLVLELVRREDNGSITSRSTVQDRIAAQILRQMREQYQTLTLSELAESYHFHVNYLSRLIRRCTGQSFSEHLTQIRLSEAEKLLISTDLPIAEIAAQIGYAGPTFLFRLFQLRHGLTPQQYRQRYFSTGHL